MSKVYINEKYRRNGKKCYFYVKGVEIKYSFIFLMSYKFKWDFEKKTFLLSARNNVETCSHLYVGQPRHNIHTYRTHISNTPSDWGRQVSAN